jgi:hypothetical protein
VPKANFDAYPNTAEVIATFVGDAGINGLLIEQDPLKFSGLADRWDDHPLEPVCASWRAVLPRLQAPADLDRPWLFSMDPMTFVPERDTDDDKVHPHDFNVTLVEPVRSFLLSEQSGVFLATCYSMIPAATAAYRAAVQQFADDLRVAETVVRIATVSFGGSSHVAALISRNRVIVERMIARWAQVRDYKLDWPQVRPQAQGEQAPRSAATGPEIRGGTPQVAAASSGTHPGGRIARVADLRGLQPRCSRAKALNCTCKCTRLRRGGRCAPQEVLGKRTERQRMAHRFDPGIASASRNTSGAFQLIAISFVV